MLDRYDNTIVHVVCTLSIPFIQLYGLYIVLLAHYGVGGGFQGALLIAVGFILQRIYLGKELAHRIFSSRAALIMASIGMILYVLAGLGPMLFGGEFLDFAYYPFPGIEVSTVRYLMIYFIEGCIVLTVTGTLVLLFDVLAGGDEPGV